MGISPPFVVVGGGVMDIKQYSKSLEFGCPKCNGTVLPKYDDGNPRYCDCFSKGATFLCNWYVVDGVYKHLTEFDPKEFEELCQIIRQRVPTP
jgi:hypothetical protein